MLKFDVVAQSYLSSDRIRRFIVASSESEALIAANMQLNGDYYVLSVDCIGAVKHFS